MATRSRYAVAVFLAVTLALTGGCGENGDADTTKDPKPAPAKLQEGGEAKDAAPAADAAYVEQVQKQILDLEITAEAMESGAAAYPDDDTLQKMRARVTSRLESARNKAERVAKIKKESTLLAAKTEVEKAIAAANESIAAALKRIEKLAQLAQRRAAKEAADEIDDEVDDESADEGDGGE